MIIIEMEEIKNKQYKVPVNGTRDGDTWHRMKSAPLI
jgi:hypothetical protein